MDAARTVRRADAAMAVPALIEAVNSHADGYVRFRALVAALGLQRSAHARRACSQSLDERNDRAAHGRLRLVRAQSGSRRRAAAPHGAGARGGRVRPAGTDPRARGLRRRSSACSRRSTGLVMQRPGLLPQRSSSRRSATTRRRYALQPIIGVAKLDGPLQDDAVLAIGQDRRQARAWRCWQPAADGAAESAAGDRRGDLPARRQLRIARRATSSTR